MKKDKTDIPVSSLCPRCAQSAKESLALRAESETLRTQSEALRAENKELKEALTQAQRAGKRQAAPFSRGKKKENPKRPGRKDGHPGATRARPDHVDHTLEAAPLDGCPDCGGTVEKEQTEENFETDLPRSEPKVTRFVFWKAWCPHCKKRVHSYHPRQTSTATGAAASHVGPRVRALAADLKCRLGIPYRKITDLLEVQFKIQVTAGALVHSNHRLAQRAASTVDEMKKALAQETVVGADETGWRVAGISHWLWVACSERFTIYEITPDRCAKVIREILGEDFEGFLMRDGWSSYDAQLSYRMLRCLRHLQRNAEDLEDVQSDEATAEGIALFILWIDGVFELKKKHRAEKLTPAQYHEQAQEMIVWLDEFLKPSEHSCVVYQNFAERMKKIREHIVPILENPDLPATNNLSERQIRPAVVHRKISAGTKTEKGSNTLAVLGSLGTSCHQNLVKFAHLVEDMIMDYSESPAIFWEQGELTSG
jgi:transposase